MCSAGKLPDLRSSLLSLKSPTISPSVRRNDSRNYAGTAAAINSRPPPSGCTPSKKSVLPRFNADISDGTDARRAVEMAGWAGATTARQAHRIPPPMAAGNLPAAASVISSMPLRATRVITWDFTTKFGSY
jgi:hypothetical protein